MNDPQSKFCKILSQHIALNTPNHIQKVHQLKEARKQNKRIIERIESINCANLMDF